MDVAFLDANVLFSAAYKQESRVLRLWDLSDLELVTSSYAVEEAHRNLTGEDQRKRLGRLLRSMRIVAEVPAAERLSAGLPRDLRLPDDDLPILLAAIEAGASHLLTGDFQHFGRFFGRDVRGVRILPPGEFIRSRAE